MIGDISNFRTFCGDIPSADCALLWFYPITLHLLNYLFFVEQYGRDALDAAAVMAPSASDTAAVARAAMTAATLAVVVLLRDVAAAVCRLDVAAAASTGTAAAAI